MKVKKLREILGPGGIIADYGDYIGVGTEYIHDIIRVDKKKKTVTISISGRSFDSWMDSVRKLEALVKTPEFDDIVNGDDEKGEIVVFYARKGVILQETTDDFSWPNVTHTGKLMYMNVFFLTRKEATEHAIAETKAGIELLKDRVEQKRKELEGAEKMAEELGIELELYKEMMADETGDTK